MLHLWIISTYSFGPAETGCGSQWDDDWPRSFPLIAHHKKKRVMGVCSCASVHVCPDCVCVATKQWSPAGWKDTEEVEEWGVWQFSVRRGNGMVLLKLVIRLLWHPACMEDVRGSPPGGEEVHRSGSVIFSVSATLSLVHCQPGPGRSISATLLFSLPKCSNICRKNAQTCWALDCWHCACVISAQKEHMTQILTFDKTKLSPMTITGNQRKSELEKTLHNQLLWPVHLKQLDSFQKLIYLDDRKCVIKQEIQIPKKK